MEPFEQMIEKSQFVETESEDMSFLFKLAAKNNIENG